MTKIGFVLDPLDSLKEWKDTSILMMRTAVSAGHEVHAIPYGSICASGRETRFESLRLDTGNGERWHTVIESCSNAKAGDMDAIVMRKDPPFDMAYLRCVQLLGLAEREGTLVFNRPDALAMFDEKLATLRYTQFAPQTLVTSDAERIRAFHREHRGCVVKPLGRMGGSGVHISPAGDPDLDSTVAELTEDGISMVMAQQTVAAAKDGDKRVLVIDGTPEPYMLRRVPQEGDFRGNLAAGAKAIAEPLGATERKIAETVGQDIAAQGILLAGLDILGDRLTEINITSPTCMREILDQTGHNCAERFIECIACRARQA